MSWDRLAAEGPGPFGEHDQGAHHQDDPGCRRRAPPQPTAHRRFGGRGPVRRRRRRPRLRWNGSRRGLDRRRFKTRKAFRKTRLGRFRDRRWSLGTFGREGCSSGCRACCRRRGLSGRLAWLRGVRFLGALSLGRRRCRLIGSRVFCRLGRWLTGSRLRLAGFRSSGFRFGSGTGLPGRGRGGRLFRLWRLFGLFRLCRLCGLFGGLPVGRRNHLHHASTLRAGHDLANGRGIAHVEPGFTGGAGDGEKHVSHGRDLNWGASSRSPRRDSASQL